MITASVAGLYGWSPAEGVAILVDVAAHRDLTTTPGDPGVPR